MPEIEDDDIDIINALNQCTPCEIEDCMDWLKENGYLPKFIPDMSNKTSHDVIWIDKVCKLLENKHRLTVQDEETILAIYDKLF